MADNIYIEKASKADAEFIAKCVFSAFLIDLEKFDVDKRKYLVKMMAEVCGNEETLYSWKNSTKILFNGCEAGILIAYDGARYRKMFAATMPLIKPFMTDVFGEGFEEMEDETHEGEFYLDTLSVVEDFRHKGLASRLILDAIAKTKKMNIPDCTLIVNPENYKAIRLYESLGFGNPHDIFIFNENYLKMSCSAAK